jgi:hypothetical protein
VSCQMGFRWHVLKFVVSLPLRKFPVLEVVQELIYFNGSCFNPVLSLVSLGLIYQIFIAG